MITSNQTQTFRQGLVLLISLCTLLLSSTALCTPQKLIFFTWEDYIDPEVVSEFEKEFDAKVEFYYFEHDTARDELIATPEGKVYDVIMVDGETIATYIRQGWLAPINPSQVPNLKQQNTLWQTLRPEAIGYSAPYGWGTLGIVYRKDLVKQPIDSLMKLFTPVAELRNKIIMSPQIDELVSAALLALHIDPNSQKRDDIQRAANLIHKQQASVYQYQALELNENSPLVLGKVFAAQAYSGDALMLNDFNENIEYRVPIEGAPLWVDFLTVSSTAPHQKLAYEFINFLYRPAINARNIAYTYTASFSDAAKALLPTEITDDPKIYYPNIEQLVILKEASSNIDRQKMMLLQSLNLESHNSQQLKRNSQ